MGILTANLLLVTLLATSQQAVESPPQFTLQPGQATAARGVGADGLPVAKDALVISLEGDLALGDLIGAYSKATGVRVMMTEDVRATVVQTSIAGYGGDLVLPGAELQGFFEGVLARSGYRLAMTHRGKTPVLTLLKEAGGRGDNSSPWLHVPAEQLGDWSHHQALLVQTVLPCRGVDSRQLSTSLRMMTSPPFSTLMATAEGSSIVFQGTGTQAARMQAVIQRAEAEAAIAAKAAAVTLATPPTQQPMALQPGPTTQGNPIEVAAALAQGSTPAELGFTMQPVAPTLATMLGNAQKLEASSAVAATGRVMLEPSLASASHEVASPELPKLQIGVLEVESDLRSLADLVQDLAMNRHQHEQQHRVWFQTERGDLVHWPRPRFLFPDDSRHQSPSAGGLLIVQGAQEDLDWIRATMAQIASLKGDG
ncbi:MAG: hypothetical protein P1V81_05885 [Planctomycetota bacterium]|nr:hypothetical protein [Planctomycetota bacterium]